MADTETKVGIGFDLGKIDTTQFENSLNKSIGSVVDKLMATLTDKMGKSFGTALENTFKKMETMSNERKVKARVARRTIGIERRNENYAIGSYKRATKDEISDALKSARTVDQFKELMERWAPTPARQMAANTNLAVGDWSRKEKMDVWRARFELQGYDTAQREFDRLMKKMEESAESTSSRIGAIFSGMFGKVGKFAHDIFTRMRTILIRGIARQLLGLVKEGLSLLTEWDRTFGNNTSHAAETVEQLSATWRQLKKTIGAAFMPLIQIAKPAIDFVANAVMGLFNIINQILRRAQGYSTYMKATYKVIKQNTGAAKELKKTLFGFDELNILPSDSGAGGGSGILYDDFKETKIGLPTLKEIFANNDDRSLWQVIKDKFVEDWQNAIATTKEGWNEFCAHLKEVFGPIGQFLSNAWESIKTDFQNHWDTLKEWASDTWSRISDGFQNLASKIKEIAKALWEGLMDGLASIALKFKAGWDTITNWASAAWGAISLGAVALWNKLKEGVLAVVTFFTNAWTKLKDTVTNVWEKAKQGAQHFWEKTKSVAESIQTVFSKAWDNIAKMFTKAWEMITKLLSKGGELFEGIKEGVGNIFKSLVNGIIKGLNAVIAAPIKALNTILTKLKEINILGLQPFKNFVNTIAVPQIPLLASGGMVPNKGTLFMANEAGPEVVYNSGNATGVMNATQMEGAIASGNSVVVHALYAVAEEIINTVVNKNWDVNLDGRKIGQSVTKYQEDMRRSYGY